MCTIYQVLIYILCQYDKAIAVDGFTLSLSDVNIKLHTKRPITGEMGTKLGDLGTNLQN